MKDDKIVGLFRLYYGVETATGCLWGVWYAEDRNCAPIATFAAYDVAVKWAEEMSR